VVTSLKGVKQMKNLVVFLISVINILLAGAILFKNSARAATVPSLLLPSPTQAVQPTPSNGLDSNPCLSSLILTAGDAAVFSKADVERALEKLPQGQEYANLKRDYERMLVKGDKRYLLSLNSISKIQDMEIAFPNFKLVIGHIVKRAAQTIKFQEPFHIDPILFLGPPGVGKTHFAKSLGDRAGTDYTQIQMNSLTAGWILSGSSAQWRGARPGKVADGLVQGLAANPIFMLDEIDKVPGQTQYDPSASLYALLEKNTAAQFRDEYYDVDFDASHIIWIATANDERSIPAPILNRFNVYEISAPTKDEVRAIGAGIYSDIVRAHPKWNMQPAPSESVLDKITSLAPRDIARILRLAFDNATWNNRDHLLPEDIDINFANGAGTKPFGFLGK
jgi:ATP-dependent Lon protease